MARGYKTGGRTKGTPNKTTASVKEALEQCFEKLGGVDVLAKWAQENQTEFYKLWAKILPKDLQLECRGPLLEELVAGALADDEGRD